MTARRDLDKEVAVALTLVPAARNATGTGTTVDLSGYTKAMAVVSFGVVTDGTHTPKMQHSDDDSTWADTAAADRSGSFSAATSSSGGSAVQEVGYLGSKRYVRVVITMAGATTGALCSASIIRAGARTLPQ